MYTMPSEENIKSIFYSEVRERKAVGRGGYHKKGGSKSKKCNLPSDNLSERGWRKMNGPVNTINMNAPMAWGEFKELRADLKEQYIRNLVERFGVTKAALAEVFGINVTTFMRYTKDVNMGELFYAGKKMKVVEKKAFYEFFGITTEESDSTPVIDSGEDYNDSESVIEESEFVVPIAECVAIRGNAMNQSDESDVVKPATQSKFAMQEFSIEFKGAFDADHVANSLRSIIGAGTLVKVKITCDVLEK